MSADINLLLPKDEASLKRHRKIKIFNFLAIMSLVVTGTISLILFLTIQSVDVSSVKKEQNNVLQQISKFQDRQAKLFVVENRINNVSEILEKKKDLSSAVTGLLKNIPSGLIVDAMEIDSNSVSITAKSSSLSTIGSFIINLTDMVRKKEVISSLTISSLIYDENNAFYQVSVKSDI